MARGFLTVVSILAYFPNPFINGVFASLTQSQGPKLSLASIKADVQPRRQRGSLWPEAAVIYEIHPGIGCPTSFKCKIIMDAMEQYEKNSCVRFKDRSGERNFVEIFDAPDRINCSTVTGRIGYGQTLALGTECWYREAIMHELGHTVGLPDEITRPDRDEYVEINFDNISPDEFFSFRKEYPLFPSVLTTTFDYNSIMMYGPGASAVNPEIPTLTPKKVNKTIPLFQDKDKLSDIDKRRISILYQSKGTDQKPDFPFDVRCPFYKDMCGFKNLNDGEWSLRDGGNRKRQSMSKYVGIDFRKDNGTPARLVSVHFHALSPLDKVRGPNGCVSFSYFISSDKTASLKLSLKELYSPRQLEYEYSSAPSWARSGRKVDLTTASIPVPVTKPFAFVFQAEFEADANEGAIGMDDFELSYSPCKNPTDAPLSSALPSRRPQLDLLSVSTAAQNLDSKLQLWKEEWDKMSSFEY